MTELPAVDNQDRLYVGSRTEYKQAVEAVTDVDFVLNLSFDCGDSHGGDTSYAHLPFNDGNTEYRDFRQACDLLVTRYQRYREQILVHCAAGVSRSVSVAAVTVGIAETTGFDTALEQVMTRRNIGIDPNPELQRYGRKYIEDHGL